VRKLQCALRSMWVAITCVSILVKLLTTQLYRSTDYDVHRDWLLLTHRFPWSQWYSVEMTQWTLDYPPFFAWFEYSLTQLARVIFGNHFESAFDSFSFESILFMKLSVILSELVLILAALYYLSAVDKDKRASLVPHSKSSRTILCLCLILFNPALFIVDHIHFQYNGFLLGIFLLSIAAIRNGNDLAAALLFAILLNFKHIFMYVAPAFFCYLLGNYCWKQKLTRVSKTSKLTA